MDTVSTRGVHCRCARAARLRYLR